MKKIGLLLIIVLLITACSESELPAIKEESQIEINTTTPFIPTTESIFTSTVTASEFTTVSAITIPKIIIKSDDIAYTGEDYIKDFNIDDIDNNGKGISFVKNQFLLTAYNNISYTQIEELVSQYDAKIVGFIGLTNSFQLEIIYDVNADRISKIINDLISNPLVEFASFNTVLRTEPDVVIE